LRVGGEPRDKPKDGEQGRNARGNAEQLMTRQPAPQPFPAAKNRPNKAAYLCNGVTYRLAPHNIFILLYTLYFFNAVE
jgi:hypothetical protein